MSARESVNLDLPVPDHYDPERVDEIWRVPYQEHAMAAAAWADEHAITPAHTDERRVGVLLIDIQNTFCIPGHELYVGGRSGTGAVDDNRRLCEFLYRNLATLTAIHPTLDTHTATQIFHPVFLVDDAGEHPAPMTAVPLADIESGTWKLNPDVAHWVRANEASTVDDHLRHYARELEANGKHSLMIWPYHAMLGGVGHALVSSVEEAVFFHGIARAARTSFELKGSHPLTENYSVLRPEVTRGADGAPLASANTGLTDRLLSYDALIVAGQAKSHCVAWSVADLLAEIGRRDPELAGRVYLLEDCTSPVVVPGVVDTTDEAAARFARFADAGMHIVRSTTPVTDWPGPLGGAP